MANEFVIKNGFISKGDSIVSGTISGNTLYLQTTPTLNPSATEILARNSSTGEVERTTIGAIISGDTFVTGGTYSEVTDTITLTRNDGASIDITGVTDTFITGFTYDNNNTFTISINDGTDISTSINTVSALTVTNYIDYTTETKPSAISGRTYFDVDENALSYFPQTPANDVTINIGQESVIRVHNNTGVQINNGEVCHITSEEPSVNGVPSVVLAIATGSTTTGSRYLVSGVATHDIPNGTEGFITEFGLVRDLNITGVTEGTEIYLSETTPGAFRYSAPDIEFRRSVVGYVVTTGTTTGKILVEITNEVGFSELSESLLSVVTENNSSTGTRNGGEITINSGDNTLFDISSGSGIIVDNYTDPNDPTITNVVWDNITGNTVTNLTADTASFIFLNSSLNTVQFGISNPPTEADYRDNIFLGIVGHANFTNLINVFNIPIQIVSPINQHQDLTSAIGPFSINGNRILNITGTLELEKTAGNSYFYGGNFHTDNKVPSNITTSNLSGSTLIYAKGTAVLGPTSSDIDPNNYDPDGAGTITAIPGIGAYVAHRIWHQPSQNLLVFQYGQEYYPNAATARDEFEFENFVVPPGLNEVAYLVAVIIAQDGDTDLDSATIIPQGKFAGTGGGGGSAADTLQTAYDNSSSPEIVTDPTRGAVDFRVGSGSDSDNLVTFQQSSGTINAFVEGTGDAKFTNLTGTSVTSNSAINVFNGHINLRDNSYFLQGRTVADANVSLIGVDNQDRVFIGNAGYLSYIDSDTIVDGVLSAQTAFLTTLPTLNNSATDILVRNSSTGEVEYRPVSGITPDTNTFVTGGTYNDTTDIITLTRNDGVTIDITGVTDNFVIAGTYSDSTDTISLLRQDGSFVNITGVTDTFTTGATYDNGTATATFTRNDGNSYTLDLSSIDVNDTFSTGGTVTQSSSNNENNQTIQIVGNDGFSSYNITGVTDTFTTGGTYNNGTSLITFDKNDGTSYNVDLSSIDVNDTFITGFTYNDANTFTLNRNDGADISTSINIVTGLTVNGDIEMGNSSTRQIFSTGVSDISSIQYATSGTSVQTRWDGGGDSTVFSVNNTDFTSISSTKSGFGGIVYGADYSANYDDRSLIDLGYFNSNNRYVTGGTYDNNTALISYSGANGFPSFTVDLSSIDVNDTFVTGSSVASNVLEVSRNDAQKILQLSGGSNIQFVDNGSNSITLNATTSGGGASVSFPWKFKVDTAAANPGSGQFRLNDTIPSGITEIYVNDETNNGIDASNLLNILDVGDVIYIQQNDDATRALLFTVSASTVDNTGWFTIPVQYQQGSQIPKKDKICGWIFASTGAEDNTVSNIGLGQGIFKQRNVNDFEFYSLSGGTNTTLSVNDDTIVIDVSLPPSMNTYVTGGTYSDATDTITLTRNDAVTIDITGVTDTFTTGSTYDNGTATATFTRNDGNTYTLDLSTIDVNDTFSTGGTVTQSSSNNNSNQTIQIVGNDGFSSYNITGVTDTFVTGTTFNSNQATVTRNDGTDVFLLTGGTNVTLSNPSTNQIKIDVSSSLSVVSVTGTTYSATTSDDVIGFDTSSVTPTLFLPDSTSSGTKRYEVKDIGVNSRRNPITIQAAGSDTIITTSLVSSFELSADGGAVILVSTGAGQWWQM